MYGPKKTNINGKKTFHLGSGQNRERIEKAEAEHSQKLVDAAARKATLEKEHLQRQYDALRGGSSAVVGGSGKLTRRLSLFVDDSEAAASAPSTVPTPSAGSSSINVGAVDGKSGAATGAISKEEAASIRRALDDERKARDDPLAVIRAREAAVAAAMARHAGGPHSLGTGNAAPSRDGDTSGLRRFLPSAVTASAGKTTGNAVNAGSALPPSRNLTGGVGHGPVAGLRRMQFQSE
jgi:hypothetical protein